MYMSFHFYF